MPRVRSLPRCSIGQNANSRRGEVAAALMEKAGSLLVKPPQIHKLGILADKLPG